MSDVTHDAGKTWYHEARGVTITSYLPRPFAVVGGGRHVARHYGSLQAARLAAPAGSRIFFEQTPGCGTFVEHR